MGSHGKLFFKQAELDWHKPEWVYDGRSLKTWAPGGRKSRDFLGDVPTSHSHMFQGTVSSFGSCHEGDRRGRKLTRRIRTLTVRGKGKEFWVKGEEARGGGRKEAGRRRGSQNGGCRTGVVHEDMSTTVERERGLKIPGKGTTQGKLVLQHCKGSCEMPSTLYKGEGFLGWGLRKVTEAKKESAQATNMT